MRYNLSIERAKNVADEGIIRTGDALNNFVHQRVVNAFDRKIARLNQSLADLKAELPIDYQLTDEGRAAVLENLNR